MKSLIKMSIAFLLLVFFTSNVKALTFQEGLDQSSKTPVVVLIYAEWAEKYEDYLSVFRNLEADFEGVYNFVELNIASKDTLDFNKRYHIYPNLPYVLMFKENGKISRYVQRDCAKDESCIKSKLKSFIQ